MRKRARYLPLLSMAALALQVPHIAVAAEPPPPAPARASAAILASNQQRHFDEQLLAILAHPEMQAAIHNVETLYAADRQGKTAAGKATIQRAAHAIATAAAQYAVGAMGREDGAYWVVNAPHSWFGLDVPGSGYGIDNPDNVYRNIFVDGDGRYEIVGRIVKPGPAEVHFELRAGIPGTQEMTKEGGRLLPSLRSDQLDIGPNGDFTITVDNQPANGRANHLQLTSEGRILVIVRDLIANWGAENPVALKVRRTDGKQAKTAALDDMVQEATRLLAQIAPFWVEYNNSYIFSRPANEIGPVRARPEGRGFATSGHFSLAPDEAWVITLSALGAKSLGFQLTDPWGTAYPYVEHTSSLSSSQAAPNPDGSYTFVISTADPGYVNWLDPQGHTSGIFAIRWQAAPQGTDPKDAVIASQVVKLDNLGSALAQGAEAQGAEFLSTAERETQRAERRTTYLHRLGR